MYYDVACKYVLSCLSIRSLSLKRHVQFVIWVVLPAVEAWGMMVWNVVHSQQHDWKHGNVMVCFDPSAMLDQLSFHKRKLACSWFVTHGLHSVPHFALAWFKTSGWSWGWSAIARSQDMVWVLLVRMLWHWYLSTALASANWQLEYHTIKLHVSSSIMYNCCMHVCLHRGFTSHGVAHKAHSCFRHGSCVYRSDKDQ